jgi:hypothetical protein
MTKLNTPIRTMKLEEQRYYQLHNKGLMLDYQNNSYFLNAGTRDDIEVWKHGAGLYVFTLNGYCGDIGLDAYMPNETEPINSIFLQEYEVDELLGKRWKDMSTRTIASRLMDYLI